MLINGFKVYGNCKECKCRWVEAYGAVESQNGTATIMFQCPSCGHEWTRLDLMGPHRDQLESCYTRLPANRHMASEIMAGERFDDRG